MLVLAVVFCAGTFGLNFQMTTALMATDVFGKGAGEYGILGSILAIGSLTGSLLAARRAASRVSGWSSSPHSRSASVEVVAGLMPSYLLFAVALPLCGVASMTVVTAANTFVQMSVSPQMRGRVMALYMAIFMGGTPLGAPLLGWVAEHFGARWTLVGGGALTAIGTLVAVAGVLPAPRCRRRAGWQPRPHLAVTRRPEVLTDTLVA